MFEALYRLMGLEMQIPIGIPTGSGGGRRGAKVRSHPPKYPKIFMVLQDPGNSQGQISISIPYLDI